LTSIDDDANVVDGLPLDACSRSAVTFRYRLAVIVALAAIYVAAAKFGFTMAFTADQVTLVWPPTGLSLAALMLFGIDVWPGVFLGAFIANFTTHEGVGVAGLIAAGNTLEAVVAAWGLRRFVGTGNAVSWLRYAVGISVFAAAGTTMISATIGVTSLCLGGLQPWTAFTPLWWRWWLGDAAGDLLIAPLILTWRARPRARDPIEICTFAICIATAAYAVFGRRVTTAAMYPLEYTLFPLIIWTAIRFGIAGASIANVLTAGIAVWGTVRGFGPYGLRHGDEELMLLQVFLGVVATSGLILGAAISERDASKARKAGMLEAALDCIISLDHLGRILEFNPAAERTFGFRKREVMGREMADVIIPERLREHHRRGLAQYSRDDGKHFEGRRFETIAQRADGREFPVELSITRIPSDGPPVFTGFLRDITEQRNITKQLTFRATHDGLTKMLTGAAFMERLTVAVAQANSAGRGDIAVLFVDLNKFKAVNDEFGHAVGDRLLVAIGRRLRASVRPSDSVGRMGGDEFAVILERFGDMADVLAVVERIQKALDRPFKVDGRRIRPSASVGIAFASQHGSRAEDLIRAADAAMYKAKAQGAR
jgi:diguanylate cyclase (GGDEF)-like protein/PAS domain S-box-containing protein